MQPPDSRCACLSIDYAQPTMSRLTCKAVTYANASGVLPLRRNVFNSSIREGQAVNEDGSSATNHSPGGTASVRQIDGDSGCNSGDDSDDSTEGALLDDETAASAAMQARTIALPLAPLVFAPASPCCKTSRKACQINTCRKGASVVLVH